MPADTSKGLVRFFDDFMGDTINLDLYVTNADTGGTAYAVNVQHNGVIRGIGDGTDNDLTNIYTPPMWRADAGGLTFETRVNWVTSLANGENFIGMSDQATDELPINLDDSDAIAASAAATCVGFAYTGTGTANWKCVSSNADANGAVTAANQGGVTTPVVGTWQTFKITINTDGDADYYIDGIWQAREDLAVPPATLLNIYMCQADGGTARSTDIDYFEVIAGRR